MSDESSGLSAAVLLSHRYISDRFLPDKAIDLVDEACAMIRTEIDSMPAELDELTRRVMRLEIEERAPHKMLRHEWILVVDAVLSIVLAAILVFAPVAGALAIMWAIGWYALFSSGVLAAQAWQLRKVRERGPAGGWAPQGA